MMRVNVCTTEEKLALIKRNLQEVLGEDTISSILEQQDLRVYWGTATTGRPHIAYFLPMTKLADFLKAGCEVTVLFADLHAYLDNMKAPWELLKHRTRYYEVVIKGILESIGVPLDKLKFVKGTDYQLSREYILDVFRLSTICSEHDAKKAGSEVVKQVENAMLSGLIYPGMQALDEHYLEWMHNLGVLIRGRSLCLLKSIFHNWDTVKRAHLMNPMVAGLTGTKMSSSEPDTKVDLLDDPVTVTRKIQKAFCEEGNIERNGILPFVKNVLFPVFENKSSGNASFVIERPEKYGGKVQFDSYEALEQAFAEKQVHPGDLKQPLQSTSTNYLIPFVHGSKPQRWPASLGCYPEDASKLEIISKAMAAVNLEGNKNEPRCDFSRFDLRVGQIRSVQRHPDAEKLYIESIDVGEDKPRTVLSGIAEHFTPEELVGRLVVVFCNLRPAVMRGIESHGMLAAADNGTIVELVEAPQGSKPGDRVFVPGYEFESCGDLIDGRKKDKKLFDQVFAEWKTDDDRCQVVYRDVPMRTQLGTCTVKSLTHASIH